MIDPSPWKSPPLSHMLECTGCSASKFEREGDLKTYFQMIFTLHCYYFYVLSICFCDTKLYGYQATEVTNIFPCM
jgi:hypothetical protein